MFKDRSNILLLLLAAILIAGAALPSSPRAFQVLVLAAMIAALWTAGSRIVRWLVPDFGGLSHAVAAFTFAVAVAVVPATWMGHFGVMWPRVFLGWTAAVAVMALFLPRPMSGNAEVRAAHPTGRWERIDTALLIAFGLTLSLYGLADMVRLRFAPAGPYGFDDTSYHLAAVATWLRHGDLRMIRFSVGDASTPFYPVLSEVASWTLFAPFRDSDVAARWTQLPFAFFSILAVAAIARRLGLSNRAAALGALVFASLYRVLPVLAVSAGNDHSTSFFTLAAVDAGLALVRRPRAGTAVITGTALGLLLATKYIGVLYAPVVLAILGLAWLVERKKEEARMTPRTAAGLLGLLAAALAVTAGYTYLRNAVTTGNPIFPAPVRLFGFEIFPGWESASITQRDTLPEFQIDLWNFLTHRRDLFGPFFPFTLLPAALGAPLVALWRRKWVDFLVFSLPILFFLEFLFLMHDHRDMRYFLPGVALAAVGFAWLLEWLDWAGSWTLPFRAALLLVMTYQVIRRFNLNDFQEVTLTLALAALGFLAAREAGRWTAPKIPSWRWVAVPLILIAAFPFGWLINTYQDVKLAEQPSAFVLEKLAGPAGAKVAYVGLNRPYHYFGSRLQNDVQIVPRNWNLDAQYYRWGGPVTDPYFGDTTYRRWRRILGRLGIQWIVVIRTPWTDPERLWIGQRQRDFRLEYQDPEAEIWRVVARPEATGNGGGGPARRGRRAGAAGSTPASGNGSRSPG